MELIHGIAADGPMEMNEIKSNPEYSLISATPRLEWLAENEGVVISQAESDRYVELMRRAEAYCFAALARVWECETLLFWHAIDTDDLFLWLQEDDAQLAAAIDDANLKELLGIRVMCLVRLMDSVEACVRNAEENIPAFEAEIFARDEASQLQATLAFLEAKNVFIFSDDENVQSDHEGWYDMEKDENIYHVDESELVTPGYGTWAFQVAAREMLKILRGRANLRSKAYSETRPAYVTEESSELVDEIRRMKLGANSAFLLDRPALPAGLSEHTTERMCLAATIDDAWFERPHVTGLSDSDIKCFLATGTSNSAPTALFRLGSGALWLDAQKTLDYLVTARTERAILYVGTKQCCLVVHRFNHFAELLQLFRQNASAKEYPDVQDRVSLDTLSGDEASCNSLPASLKRKITDLR
ncbi:hypothetical protein [Paraburkholderia azotifigens]|uniref:Uncharacterized protein n=1 Tax=Paraburkholderia azotifigens TaxID=2057004 RepID=A0A5C6V8A3_9BURK|nr:hypothetical protein [Paraburkholderia azotifigens]TXC81024.1 hypothetical protein FRZ40_43290 [Paraburkholderia azotifigens]